MERKRKVMEREREGEMDVVYEAEKKRINIRKWEKRE